MKKVLPDSKLLPISESKDTVILKDEVDPRGVVIMHRGRYKEFLIEQCMTSAANFDELYGKAIEDLFEIVSVNPLAVLQAAKEEGWRKRSYRDTSTMYFSKRISAIERVEIQFIPFLTDPDFISQLEGPNDGSVSISYYRNGKYRHPDEIFPDRFPDILFPVRSLIKRSQTYMQSAK